ncbi:MAG: TIGR04282 family arsenosugar biosynthesis glycosyltransferase [Gemmatimonadales bacterium]
MTPALAVFLKAPRLGTVKTRLAAQIGDRHALRLYRVMAARTLAAVRESGFGAAVWFTPADAAAEMRFWLGEAWELRPQASGDLGARLAAAAHSVEPGSAWIAIGADCPGLTPALLREAAAVVAEGMVAIGPTTDGGYYLIGGLTPLPDIFTAMPWSTNRLLPETRARLERVGAVWRELAVLRDVDTAEDARAEGLLT